MPRVSPPTTGPCAECRQEFSLSTPQRTKVQQGRLVYCSPSCLSVRSSRLMSRTNAENGVMRKPENNGMFRPEVRAAVSAKLRAIRHKPPVQGGNGRGMTEPERLLAELTGLTPVIVPTGSRGQGYPTHYKIDLGDAALRLAVEIDGMSHKALSRREQDRKKEAFLRGLGWTVLRFSNEQVLGSPTDCAQTVTSTISGLRATRPTSPTVS